MVVETSLWAWLRSRVFWRATFDLRFIVGTVQSQIRTGNETELRTESETRLDGRHARAASAGARGACARRGRRRSAFFGVGECELYDVIRSLKTRVSREAFRTFRSLERLVVAVSIFTTSERLDTARDQRDTRVNRFCGWQHRERARAAAARLRPRHAAPSPRETSENPLGRIPTRNSECARGCLRRCSRASRARGRIFMKASTGYRAGNTILVFQIGEIVEFQKRSRHFRWVAQALGLARAARNRRRRRTRARRL